VRVDAVTGEATVVDEKADKKKGKKGRFNCYDTASGGDGDSDSDGDSDGYSGSDSETDIEDED